MAKHVTVSNLGVDMSASGVENDELSKARKVALVGVGHCAEHIIRIHCKKI